MGIGYKKLTKEDIDFPRYCLFFIKTICNVIDASEVNEKDFLSIDVPTTYPYCSDAFDLIIKTFVRKGLEVKTPTFKMEMKDNVRFYNYKWKMKKKAEWDDLPF